MKSFPSHHHIKFDALCSDAASLAINARLSGRGVHHVNQLILIYLPWWECLAAPIIPDSLINPQHTPISTRPDNRRFALPTTI